MARNSNKRICTVRPTLLAVGEGITDKVFLNYLRSLYCGNYEGVQLTTRPAHGKNPQHIINFVINQTGAYDKRLAFLDSDVVIPEDVLKKAQQNKIIIILSKPCLEGMLLCIHDKLPPTKADPCKKELKNLFPNGDFTDVPTYQKHFPFELIETSRNRIPELDQLIKLIKGEW